MTLDMIDEMNYQSHKETVLYVMVSVNIFIEKE